MSDAPPIPIPKPQKRPPKPPTRLSRKKRPRKARKGTKAQLAREADRLWSLIVRAKGKCEVEGVTEHLQAAHGFSRRYRNTRWLPINGFCLSRAVHVYYTHRPIEWDQYLREVWGEQVYNELRLLALRTTPPDVGAALAALQSEAKARGIL